jgi:hypothetical protein
MEPHEPNIPGPVRESAQAALALDVPRDVDDPGAIEFASWLWLLSQSTPALQLTRPNSRGETR